MIDTTGTYHAAYILAAVIYVGYALSLRMRARKYRDHANDQHERGSR